MTSHNNIFRITRKEKTLPGKLDALNVKTNYEMLLSSEMYKRQYKLVKTDGGLYTVKEEKYIMVPSYGFDGQEKET